MSILIPTPPQVVWVTLGFCDCGDPEVVIGSIQRALRAMVDRRAAESTELGWTAQDEAARLIETAVLPLGDPAALLLRYVLDAAGLTEHGGSVHGSWPTDEGLKLLAWLDKTDPEEWFPDGDDP